MTEDAAKTHTYYVRMNCMNCAANIKKALDKMKGKGIIEYDLKFEEQQVEVKTTLPPEEVLELIKTTGKDASIVPSTV